MTCWFQCGRSNRKPLPTFAETAEAAPELVGTHSGE